MGGFFLFWWLKKLKKGPLQLGNWAYAGVFIVISGCFVSSLLKIPAVDVVLVRADVERAMARIAPHVVRTPLLSSHLLNAWLGHEVVFKAENMQRVGAFKLRGALNALLSRKERGDMPRRVVAYSSGNHAQAVALAAKMLGIDATVVMPEFVSLIKQQATRGYGAELILTKTRPEAEALAAELGAQEGSYFLHTSADDDVIAGQGTVALEALEDAPDASAIFATCGGGGLASGCFLASAGRAKVFAAEPLAANDVAQSVRLGRIVGFEDSPHTIADGARTLKVSPVTFRYLKQLDGIIEVEEEPIIYWTQWLTHLLKVTVEPTAALAMAACAQWLKGQPRGQKVIVVLSGGNVGAATQRQIWEKGFLDVVPTL